MLSLVVRPNTGIGKISGEPSAVNTELCSLTFGHPSVPVTLTIDRLQRTIVRY